MSDPTTQGPGEHANTQDAAPTDAHTNTVPNADSETVVGPDSATQAPGPNDVTEPADRRPDGESPFYCPGCGRRWEFQTECTGMSAAAPHEPIAVVSTDELHGDDPESHTPAPASE